MPEITIQNARDIAYDWSEQEAGNIPGFVGTYLTGSVAWRNTADIHPASSDVDLIAVVDSGNVPDNLGKFLFEGILLEVGFVSLADISEIDTILADYHRAGAFRKTTALFDPAGKITEIQHAAEARFANPGFVLQRLEHARQNAFDHLGNFANANALHDQVTALFFGASITTHMLLVAALENPTVRRRYIASRAVLEHRGNLELHESLLATLGSRDLDVATVQEHLDALARHFDIAGSVMATPYRFEADMRPAARVVAIGGTQEMIDQGFHREAMFWLLAVFCRCRAVLTVDASKDALAGFDVDFWILLNALGIHSQVDMDVREGQSRRDIEQVWQVAIAMIESRQI